MQIPKNQYIIFQNNVSLINDLFLTNILKQEMTAEHLNKNICTDIICKVYN